MTEAAAIILAAGASTRFGQCKQLLDWHNKPFIVHTADVAQEAGLDPIVVVLGCQSDRTRAALGQHPVQITMNWAWEAGMSGSVSAGLSALPPTIDAAVFLQCDQPLVTADLLRRMVARFENHDASIVYPTHKGQRGTPVLFARRHFSELARVTGDKGGRSLVTHYTKKEGMATIEVEDPLILRDVDTPEDYEQIKQHASDDAREPEAVLADIRHLLIDMDGVLWRGETPVPGLQDFFAFLQEHQIDAMLATNNASKTPEQYVEKLARFGVEVDSEHVLTAALVSAAYLADVAAPGTRIYVIGEEGLRRALTEEGFVVTDEDAGNVDYVAVGWDRDADWKRLATASLLIHEGATFVGTNPDKSYPTERGPVPGNGALLAAIEAATGVKPIVTGKPEPRMYQEALRRMDAQPETTAMIGDRVDTDIAGAVRSGLTGLLVLSGIATEEEARIAVPQPDLVCEDIKTLTALWKQVLD